MIRWMAVSIILAAVCVQAGDDRRGDMEQTRLCSDAWYRFIDDAVATGDNQGHGPDLGSLEWQSVIAFKLGIRDDPNLPERNSDAWCRYIDRIVRGKYALSIQNGGDPNGSVIASGPSFDCDRVAADSIEEMICKDKALSARDRKLFDVYAAASKKVTQANAPGLRAEQRGWIKGRNECWKADDARACVQNAYQRRIAELEARYRLVDGRGPIRFVCEGNPANDVFVTFFQTDPPTLIAERGDSVSLMLLQPSGSGAKYQGRNESFWEHQGEASITWGYGEPPMRCLKAP